MEFLCIINVNMPNNGMLYFGLIDAKIRVSDIDLPVFLITYFQKTFSAMLFHFKGFKIHFAAL